MLIYFAAAAAATLMMMSLISLAEGYGFGFLDTGGKEASFRCHYASFHSCYHISIIDTKMLLSFITVILRHFAFSEAFRSHIFAEYTPISPLPVRHQIIVSRHGRRHFIVATLYWRSDIFSCHYYYRAFSFRH
jgi:hypothetical protein